MIKHVFQVLRDELSSLRPRHLLASILVAPLPRMVGGRFRLIALKLAGFRIGYGSIFADMPRIVGTGPITQRLSIGEHCFFNIGLTLELGAAIRIGNQAFFGQDVMLLTTSHEIGPPEHRCGPPTTAPIHIGDGVWIGARCTILPGVTINDGAVIGAGSVVTRDVPANTVAVGVPARSIRSLDTVARHS